jgi:hypothetical protein
MPAQIIVLIAITICLPLGWLVSEFRADPLTRRVMGICTILWSFGVAAMVGMLESFDANVYFTSASKKLLETSVRHLQNGNEKAVAREWVLANEKFGSTYESRAKYAEIVDQAIVGMERP